MVNDTSIQIGEGIYTFYGIESNKLEKLIPQNKLTKDDQPEESRVDDVDINKFVSALGVAPWGIDNLFPQQAVADIKKNALAMRAMKFRVDAHYGAGLISYKQELKDNSIKIVPVLKDLNFEAFKKSNNLLNFQAGIISDWEWFRMAFYEIILSNDGKKINKIYHQPAMFCRFRLMDKKKKSIDTCYISSKWGFFNSEDDVIELPVLDFENPLDDLKRLMAKDDKRRKFIICEKINELDFVYYSFPYWDPIRKTWLPVAQEIPTLKLAMIVNSMAAKFHIKIPYSYWENRYKDWNNPNIYTEERQKQTIKEATDEFNKFLTGSQNYGKSIITHYGVDPVSLKNFEEWKIEPIDNGKLDDNAHISSSQASNSEIVTSFGVDPALLGGQLPGGSEAGSGSNKREAFFIHQAQIGLDRDITTRWFNLVRDFNEWDEDLCLGYKDTDTSETLNENPTGKKTVVKV